MRWAWCIAGLAAACGHAGVVGALMGMGECRVERAVEWAGDVSMVVEEPEAAVEVSAPVEAPVVRAVDLEKGARERAEWEARWSRVMATARVAAAQPATKPWRGEVVLEGLERGARAIDMAREWSERVVQEGARVRGAMAVRAAHARANENGAGDGVGRGDGERAGAGAGEAKNTAQKGGDTARGPVVVERGSVGYPEAAARRRVEGTVVVGVRVSGEGAVGRVWVSTTSGSKELDEAGMATVRAWRFSPAIGEDGLAVESEARVPVVFRLRRGE